MPLLDMKAFRPMAPASRRPASLSRLPGTSPPQSAKSTHDCCSASSRLARNAAASSTGGSELSGMSKKQVPPPAASASEPWASPSHSVRPGSLKCTWASTMPGKT
jgi:hypothetical protein